MAKGDSADCFFHTVQKIFGRVVAVQTGFQNHMLDQPFTKAFCRLSMGLM
jgi:hypothetical protein